MTCLFYRSILAVALGSLVTGCITTAEQQAQRNEERCAAYVKNSIGIVTALNPVIGYEKSASIAKEALKTGGSVYDLVLQKGWLTKEKLYSPGVQEDYLRTFRAETVRAA